jgi:hypothetical protein
MAYFAKIENNFVTEVIAISHADCGNLEYPASEAIGQTFIKDTLKLDGLFLQTSYNGSYRATYAGIGYTYEPALDIFVAPPTPPAPEPHPYPIPEA